MDHVAALNRGPLDIAAVRAIYREIISACLAMERPLRIARERRRQDFDSNIAAQALIARAIHLTHPAGADGSNNFVRSELGAWGDWHWLRAIIAAAKKYEGRLCEGRSKTLNEARCARDLRCHSATKESSSRVEGSGLCRTAVLGCAKLRGKNKTRLSTGFVKSV